MTGKQLEVCVDSLQSAVAAVDGGADRLEVCYALSEGGLTPTPGLLMAIKKHIKRPVDVFCMVRPRAGPMVYSEGEVEIILSDAEMLKKLGADGLVFGALNTDGTIDKKLCKQFREAASGLPCTFHRAFDLLCDPLSELETVIQLGYQRILTSGGKATALEGSDTLAHLVKAAKGRIAIMAGAGVKSNNIGKIISLTGVTQCHASARICRVFSSEETSGAKMGSGNDNIMWVACPEEVRAMKLAMEEA
ncbi:copper homeostasis protein cutC homolog [Procambarus clarkii]|uniref:copper homeostasis protein cutC homolog n=1 Tax=Procambarus clarkii TaxID=6728 RepID=UPI001E674266|nr:copper homeostasis protein cutC homolog [Procambarus clarkii]XP_045601861.1 copper homeostasis protein cutC homolog [Procambarus clarkii]XP_045601863.1 copper homeostasis protein cutC homolog [Procambarus clarkii]XP_045601864.1 copper homeostasis protein cutC homolog [Procambarus clarkii]